jgi:hypothetical protein
VSSQADLDPNSGDKYLGKTGYGVENDQLTWYGEDGTKSPTMMSLPEVKIDGGEMSDHAKTMNNPLVKKMHRTQLDFLRGSAELTSSVFTNIGTGFEVTGLYLTMHGAGEIGVPLMGLGRTSSLIGTGIDVGLDLADGDIAGAGISLSTYATGRAMRHGIKQLPKLSGSDFSYDVLRGWGDQFNRLLNGAANEVNRRN